MDDLKDLRKQFVPKRAKLLEEAASLIPISHKEIVVDKKIEPLFPFLQKNKEEISFKSTKKIPFKKHCVGVLFSGGAASGGNNVLWGILQALEEVHAESRLLGFLNGAEGLIKNSYMEIDQKNLEPYKNQGGFDFLGTGRVKIETESQFIACKKTVLAHEMDGLIIIGGDDSNTNAALLAEYFLKEGINISVVGVPKTIDGDLTCSSIETSFGFDTACKVYSESIGSICKDALSIKKYYHFIKVMGRNASHVALECALQTKPNLVILSEEISFQKKRLEEVVEEVVQLIKERNKKNKNYGVILLSEGILECLSPSPLLAKTLSEQSIQKDSHGNISLSQIPTEVFLMDLVKQALIKEGYKGVFQSQGHFLGYEGRCAFPSNFDANLAFNLGLTAAVLVLNKKTGYMATLKHLKKTPSEWEPIGIPFIHLLHLEERDGVKKPVIAKTYIDLKGTLFQFFNQQRKENQVKDNYVSPGPIQLFGPSSLTDKITVTLAFYFKK